MAVCKNCGAEVAEGQVCAACGTKAEQANVNEAVNDIVGKVMNTADTTAQYDAADIAANKIWAILSYILILFILPFLVAKDSKFARYHASQGLNLFLAEIILGVVGAVLGLIPVVGAIFGVLAGIVGLAFMVLGIYNAATGKAKELPFIGCFRII